MSASHCVLTCWFALACGLALTLAQTIDPGRKSFETYCARCHGADGNGGEMGPPIALRLAERDDEQLAKFIHEGLPDRGMPPNPVTAQEWPDLLKFLRNIERRGATDPATNENAPGRNRVGIDPRRRGRWQRFRRAAVAYRRSSRPPAQTRRGAVSRGHIRDRLADLQRRSRRKPLHRR